MTKIGYEKSAKFYDFFDKKDNIDFFCSYALREGEALDIGAGTGRISIPILEKGIKVWCVEPSQKMLKQFLMKLDAKPELGVNLELIKAGASSFKIERKFKFVFMSGVFDHFLTKEERKKVLVNIYNHMANEGLLVFDMFLGLMKDSSIKPAGIYVDNEKEYRRHVGTK
ncbi:MAG: class I SAM-dependent methyltransferase, partial [Candidatus Thorarchaeota archaeon]